MLNVSTGAGSEYEGFYELLVTNPAGRTVVATWTVQPACESTCGVCVSERVCVCVSERVCVCVCVCE